MQEQPQSVNGEISLKDIVGFLTFNYRPILLCGILGLLSSAAYLSQLPKIYEATWQMQMANSSEDPASLIERLRMPTAYSIEVQHSCGMSEGWAGDYLGGKLKVDAIKKLPNIVDMKIRDGSLDQIKSCAEAIVAMITEQQRILIEEKMAVSKELLQLNQQRLQRDMKLFEDLQRNENGSLKYLAKLERINSINTRIDTLQEEMLSSQLRPARLIAPIYVPNKPLMPKTVLWLILGAVLGLMLGLLYALWRDWWRKAA
jgi:hypothetical protein